MFKPKYRENLSFFFSSSKSPGVFISDQRSRCCWGSGSVSVRSGHSKNSTSPQNGSLGPWTSWCSPKAYKGLASIPGSCFSFATDVHPFPKPDTSRSIGSEATYQDAIGWSVEPHGKKGATFWEQKWLVVFYHCLYVHDLNNNMCIHIIHTSHVSHIIEYRAPSAQWSMK